MRAKVTLGAALVCMMSLGAGVQAAEPLVSGGLATTPSYATTDGGGMSIAFVVKNTTDKPMRVFAVQPVLANDNKGNSWYAGQRSFSGLYICVRDNECLGNLKSETERSATVLEPGDSVPVVINLTHTGRSNGSVGNVVSFSVPVQAQTIQAMAGATEVAGAGPWRALTLGATNQPLKPAQ